MLVSNKYSYFHIFICNFIVFSSSPTHNQSLVANQPEVVQGDVSEDPQLGYSNAEASNQLPNQGDQIHDVSEDPQPGCSYAEASNQLHNQSDLIQDVSEDPQLGYFNAEASNQLLR